MSSDWTPPPPAAATQTRPGRPLGLVIFGVGLIATSLLQITALVDAGRYWRLFQDLSPAALMARYAVSWAARIVGVAAGMGILGRREFFRKTAIVLAWATIATVQWKHPYGAFARHISDLERHVPGFMQLFREALRQVGVELSTMTRLIVIIVRVQEIALALLLIWYLTRPHVKAQFTLSPPRAGR